MNNNILIAEDDGDDRFILKRAFEESKINNPLQFVEDGCQLIDTLKLAISKNTLPGLILLDLNMPKKDGRQALQEIKNNFELRHIPVVVFTTSNSHDDLLTSYKMGANSYIIKPCSYDKLLETIQALHLFWFKTAKIL